eukprot:2985686-Rhodomonas_salina.1
MKLGSSADVVGYKASGDPQARGASPAARGGALPLLTWMMMMPIDNDQNHHDRRRRHRRFLSVVVCIIIIVVMISHVADITDELALRTGAEEE